MLKSFVQGLAAICLFLAVLLFPTKIGYIITEIVQACWNIVITVGRNVRVPGEGSSPGVILLGVGILMPATARRLATPRTPLMMKSLRTLPTRLTAQAHASALSLEAGSTSLSRAQIGSALLFGLMVFFASDAMAAGQAGTNGVVNLIKKATNFLLLLLAAAVIGMAAWGAFLYVTSAGNSNRVNMAKDTVKNVFIGLAIAAGIFLIRQVVLDLVGGVDTGTGRGGNQVRTTLQNGGL